MQYVKKLPAFLLAAIALASSPFSTAWDTDDSILISRYVSAQIGPTQAQLDILQSVVSIDIPDEINTVGSALSHLLKPYGYRIGREGQNSSQMQILLSLPLPEPHRSFGPIKLLDALAVFGGEVFSLMVNPVSRTISYQLKSAYQNYVDRVDIQDTGLTWEEENALPILDYGPVKLGETLSGIVEGLDHDGMTSDQLMVHMFLHNPNAFVGNMNMLLEGAVLTLTPTGSANWMSAVNATQMVDQHRRQLRIGGVSHEDR